MAFRLLARAMMLDLLRLLPCYKIRLASLQATRCFGHAIRRSATFGTTKLALKLLSHCHGPLFAITCLQPGRAWVKVQVWQ
jgi:hypothetical protein